MAMEIEMLRFAAVAMTLCLAAASPAASRAPIDESALVGAWRVDLTSQPGDAPYYSEMVVTTAAGGRITGTFYGSPMENGRVLRDWGTVRFAFVTRDGGGGVYNHSGELVDGRLLRGLSHALQRDFLSVWTADRRPAP